MPEGNVKGKINCQKCIDCERMVNFSTLEESFRCYGNNGIVEIKKNFARNQKNPPKISPDWCPNRVHKEGEK